MILQLLFDIVRGLFKRNPLLSFNFDFINSGQSRGVDLNAYYLGRYLTSCLLTLPLPLFLLLVTASVVSCSPCHWVYDEPQGMLEVGCLAAVVPVGHVESVLVNV